jgi:hypothetical protein
MDRRSSSNVYTVRKFDGKNYKMWAFDMEMLLAREQAWTIVNGSELSPLEEVEKDSKSAQSIPARQALDSYRWRFYEALRLIFSALEDSLKMQYMHIKHPAELWQAIKADYVGELQKSQLWIRRELYEVKLSAHGSIDAYAMHIQNLIDDYRAGATEPEDRISDREHVFFLLNGIPRSDEWDLEVRLIHDQMATLAKDPKAVLKKLRDREDAIKSDKGISAEVALYTRSGKKEKAGTKDKTCFACGKAGHMKRNCPEKRQSTSKDSDEEAPNVAAVATTTETLWMTRAGPGPEDVDDSELEQAYQSSAPGVELEQAYQSSAPGAALEQAYKRKDARTCYFCKQGGHTRRHCPERRKAASNTDAESIADSSDTAEALDVETSPADAALAWLMQDGPIKRAGAGGAKPAEKKATRAGGARLAENNTTGKTSAGRVRPAKDVKSAEAETGARQPVKNVKTPRKGAGSVGGGSSFRRGTQRRGCAHCECTHCRQSWRSTAPIITQETLW